MKGMHVLLVYFVTKILRECIQDNAPPISFSVHPKANLCSFTFILNNKRHTQP